MLENRFKQQTLEMRLKENWELQSLRVEGHGQALAALMKFNGIKSQNT
jgi:hypothetical protein